MKLLSTFIFLLSFLIFSYRTSAQSTFVPLDKDYTTLIDRYEIKYGQWADGFHSSVKPYKRIGVVSLADSIIKNNLSSLTKTDKFNLEYLIDDSYEWADSSYKNWHSKKTIIKNIYSSKSDFFSYSSKDFDFHFNPVISYQYGWESNTNEKRNVSSRGFEIRGMIAKRIGFYTYATDNSAIFPEYVQSYIKTKRVLPGEGYWQSKSYGTDWFSARGYFTCNIIKNYIDMQFGHDRNFIGNGYRSMLLSDFSTPYLFLKINTKIWKFNYQNLFAEMNAGGLKNGEILADKKYFAFHHLSINLGKHVNIGLSEAEVFGRGDSVNNGSFDLNYLNPIIFLRPIESNMGSPDNAMIGIDFKINFLKHFLIYGQLFIDEFDINELKNYKNGSWKNKEAVQFGMKYIDFAGIPNLDWQIETNLATPYTYSHQNRFTNYANYNQSLASPLGANYYELINILHYQPLPKLNLTIKNIYAVIGYDNQYQYWGNDILRPYTERVEDYNNKLAQGDRAKLNYLEITINYQLVHNLFFEVKELYRKQVSDIARLKSDMIFTTIGLRWNIPAKVFDF